MNMNHPTVLRNICIIGNISSGKSTLATFLGTAVPHSITIPENFESNPFLKLYVADPSRWAFTNAIRYFYDYARDYHELTAGRVLQYCFIDAGGATNRHVYGRYLLEEKIITPEENTFYNTLVELIEHAYAYPEPDAFVFLDVSPEVCFTRMRQRGWDYQTNHIRPDYIVALHKYFHAYRDSLLKQRIPVLTIDSDAIDFTNTQGRAEVLARVRAFLAG